MATVTQQEGQEEPAVVAQAGRRTTRKIQLFLEEDAFLRLKTANAQGKGTLGKIASDALRAYLPEVRVLEVA